MTEDHTITNLLDNRTIRFVFVGGKGGVGKTTCSSAIATQIAYDRRVLLISTDPAHSLGDAFRMKFSGTPTTIPESPNLQVMEVNPESYLQEEIKSWADIAKEAGVDDLVSKIKEFQEWLTGIPGIDEATALSSVIGYVESGKYDVIVFDTAPTGHTLKLLQLPAILQLGIEKLQSWQSQMWSMWNLMKSGGSSDPQQLQQKVGLRLRQYKDSIERVGMMLKDKTHTCFLVVCIAEYLSVCESHRLLKDLKRQRVMASHVIVNQLIEESAAMKDGEFDRLKQHVESIPDAGLRERILNSAQLTTARYNIQQKYLKMLKSYPEVAPLRVVPMPLQASEVTGPANLLRFSQKMVPAGYRKDAPKVLQGIGVGTGRLYGEEPEHMFYVGAKASVMGLMKTPKYNGVVGTIKEQCQDGRYALHIVENGKKKTLLLRAANLRPEEENVGGGYAANGGNVAI